MKNIVKLQIEVEIICSDQYTQALQEDLAVKTLQSCFRNNTRRIVSVNILDTEVLDSNIPDNKVLEMLQERTDALAETIES